MLPTLFLSFDLTPMGYNPDESDQVLTTALLSKLLETQTSPSCLGGIALLQTFEKSWEYAQEVSACFPDLEKAYDSITTDKLAAVLLLQYDTDGQLPTAVKF